MKYYGQREDNDIDELHSPCTRSFANDSQKLVQINYILMFNLFISLSAINACTSDTMMMHEYWRACCFSDDYVRYLNSM